MLNGYRSIPLWFSAQIPKEGEHVQGNGRQIKEETRKHPILSIKAQLVLGHDLIQPDFVIGALIRRQCRP